MLTSECGERSTRTPSKVRSRYQAVFRGVIYQIPKKHLDRCLDETSALMVEAKALPGGLKSRRLAMESAAIIEIAKRLIDSLRNGDPLGPRRIHLTKPGYFWCCAKGVVRALF